MAAGAGVVLLMIVTFVLLFTSMILSAMASADAKKGVVECQENCHKWAMWSAVLCGVSFAIILGIMITFILFRRNKTKAGKEAAKKVPSPVGLFPGRGDDWDGEQIQFE